MDKKNPKKSRSTPAETSRIDEAKVLEAFELYIGDRKSYAQIEKQLGLTRPDCQRRFSEAFRDGLIQTSPPTNRKLADALREKWRIPRYCVLNASEDKLFYGWAAKVFLDELNTLLGHQRTGEGADHLRIGVVSGQTTGSMVQALCSKEPWGDDRLKRNRVPRRVSIYALNVSQTHGYRQLGGNANVLAWQLARKFTEECPDCDEVEAFGLSTDLFQSFLESQRSDTQPQTCEVIRCTDPVRLGTSLGACGSARASDSHGAASPSVSRPALRDKSALDVVITGVGARDSSLFLKYCDLNKIQVHSEVVGDIAYWPVTMAGTPMDLLKDGQKYVFYSAIRLEVLKEMVADKKKVIVVARGRPKAKPIHAAIFGDGSQDSGPYCNLLITDSDTAAFVNLFHM